MWMPGLSPNAPEPMVRGRCVQCGEELREDYTYFGDENGNTFCSEKCALDYHNVQEQEWDEYDPKWDIND